MQNDEQSIRELVAEWQNAAAAADLSKLLNLMAEDVVFYVVGQPPMRGREAFAAAFRAVAQHVRIESTATIEEIQVAGNFAPPCKLYDCDFDSAPGRVDHAPVRLHADDLRKEPDGRWVLYRDANMLTPEHSNT